MTLDKKLRKSKMPVFISENGPFFNSIDYDILCNMETIEDSLRQFEKSQIPSDIISLLKRLSQQDGEISSDDVLDSDLLFIQGEKGLYVWNEFLGKPKLVFRGEGKLHSFETKENRLYYAYAGVSTNVKEGNTIREIIDEPMTLKRVNEKVLMYKFHEILDADTGAVLVRDSPKVKDLIEFEGKVYTVSDKGLYESFSKRWVVNTRQTRSPNFIVGDDIYFQVQAGEYLSINNDAGLMHKHPESKIVGFRKGLIKEDRFDAFNIVYCDGRLFYSHSDDDPLSFTLREVVSGTQHDFSGVDLISSNKHIYGIERVDKEKNANVVRYNPKTGEKRVIELQSNSLFREDCVFGYRMKVKRVADL